MNKKKSKKHSSIVKDSKAQLKDDTLDLLKELPPELEKLKEEWITASNNSEDKEVNLKFLQLVINNRLESPELQQEIIEDIRASRVDRRNIIESGMTMGNRWLTSYNFRENLKVVVGCIFIIAMLIAVGWCLYIKETGNALTLLGLVLGSSLISKFLTRK